MNFESKVSEFSCRYSEEFSLRRQEMKAWSSAFINYPMILRLKLTTNGIV
jgi:hypothetical protein